MHNAQTTTLNRLQFESIDAGSERRSLRTEEEGVPSRPARMSEGVRTYIVEDNAIILDNLIATLEELTSVQVIGSASGEAAALRGLNQLDGEVDLVIIDVFLEQGSGLGVLRNLAARQRSAERVILTNYATADMRERCGALGAHRVFDKSCDLDELISYCTLLSRSDNDPTLGAVG